MSKLKFLLPATLAVTLFANAVGQQAPANQESKLGKFLNKPSAKYLSKKVNLPDVEGTDTFFVEVVCAWSQETPTAVVRGVRLTGYHYIGSSSSITESTFIDEDELPALIAGIRSIVTEATPATEVDFGDDLGKHKVVSSIRVSSIEGASFIFDETLVGDYVVNIDHQGFKAGKKQVFANLADRLEKASNILKKLSN